jgi:hypothetical protein
MRIETAGAEPLEIQLCFSCSNMQVGSEGGIRTIPPPWEGRLKKLFRKHGFSKYLTRREL